jgi:hypothetical protein
MVFEKGLKLSVYATFGHLKVLKMNGKNAQIVGVLLSSNTVREVVTRDTSARIA